MQYAKMKAALSERDLVEGEGTGWVQRAVSQCCLCLVWSMMSRLDRGRQSYTFFFLPPFFHLKFIAKPHLQLLEKGALNQLTGPEFDASGSNKNISIFAVATLP